MSDCTTVSVNLAERSYEIRIGLGLMSELGPLLSQELQARQAFLVMDDNVAAPYGEAALESCRAAGVAAVGHTIAAGESSKSLEQIGRLWEAMLSARLDRKAVLVAVGGGVVGDLAGFAAATYARGIRFVQVPTTLLAQVDSSVGGKTGVNLPAAKNMVGAFWQPQAVLIDLTTLSTLPEREFRAGLAEVVKYGVILDAEFFAYLEQRKEDIAARRHDALSHIIARSCRLKADVVEADEREESGRRAILNYGHTFAHAIEAVAGYGQYVHGEAVAIGMICAARLAVALGMFPAEAAQRQRDLLRSFQLPLEVAGLDASQLIAAMYRDKKTEGSRLRFILPKALGKVDLIEGVDEALVRESLGA